VKLKKRKVVPVNGIKANSFLTSKLDTGEWSASRLDPVTGGKEFR